MVPINISPLVTRRVALLRAETKSAKIGEKKFTRVGTSFKEKFSDQLDQPYQYPCITFFSRSDCFIISFSVLLCLLGLPKCDFVTIPYQKFMGEILQ